MTSPDTAANAVVEPPLIERDRSMTEDQVNKSSSAPADILHTGDEQDTEGHMPRVRFSPCTEYAGMRAPYAETDESAEDNSLRSGRLTDDQPTQDAAHKFGRLNGPDYEFDVEGHGRYSP
jgi:hypothetical protein